MNSGAETSRYVPNLREVEQDVRVPYFYEMTFFGDQEKPQKESTNRHRTKKMFSSFTRSVIGFDHGNECLNFFRSVRAPKDVKYRTRIKKIISFSGSYSLF